MENNLKLIDCVNAVAEFHDSFGSPKFLGHALCRFSTVLKIHQAVVW